MWRTMHLTVAAISVTALIGCGGFHEARPVDWESVIAPHAFDPDYSKHKAMVLRSQVLVQSQSKKGVVNGLGVPLSRTRIATAAHVVSHLAVGERLSVIDAPGVNVPVQAYDARLVYVSPETEVAIIELPDTALPESAIPQFCSKSIGGDEVRASRPVLGNNGRVSTVYDFIGYVTNITKLPAVTDEANSQLAKSGFPPRDMEGQERVVAVGVSNAVPGNSGGAIYDVDQHCVLGVASMMATIADIAPAEQLRKRIGLPPDDIAGDNRGLLFIVPITTYQRHTE